MIVKLKLVPVQLVRPVLSPESVMLAPDSQTPLMDKVVLAE